MKTSNPTSGHSIKVLTRENIWYATVTIQTSRDEYSAPYNLEAPSQTMLIELIRVVLRLREQK
jgi:hypothetical protein